MLTQERLKELFGYCPDTGVFYWTVSCNRLKPGDKAGSVSSRGYVLIKISGKYYRAHRLAWLYVYGEFPKNEIDHKDGDKTNNRIDNLRECTHAQNHQNRVSMPKSSSKYTGVSWYKNSKKWRAKIVTNGVDKYLGLYESESEAYKAYCKAKFELHEFQPQPRDL